MDSTLTQTMFMRGEVQHLVINKGKDREPISIPVLRGEVQHDLLVLLASDTDISIPVLRGEVQHL